MGGWVQKIPRIVCIATCFSLKGEDRLAPFTRLRPLPCHLLVHFLRKGRATARARTSLSESLTGRAARCLAGDRSCAPWLAGLYPSPAEQDSLSVSWRAPAHAGAAECMSESGADPAVAAWGKGSRPVLGRWCPPGRRGPGSLVEFDSWRAFGRGRLCRVVGNWLRAAVRPVPPRAVAPGQVCFLKSFWAGRPCRVVP